jgi:hypothetical protein
MGVTTWLDRITDESNLWLSAAKAEEARQYQSAAIQYLADATQCVGRGASVRAALSSFCAADCLVMLGDAADARLLYFQAGRLYSNIADHGVSGSIREALWALQRAYASYVLAERPKEAEAINEAFRLLARRANPFSGGSGWLEMPKVSPPPSGTSSGEVPKDVKKAVDAFLSVADKGRSGGTQREDRPLRKGGLVDDQESFVSQLG